METTMALRRSNLVLPEGVIELTREEMSYVEGGGSVYIGTYSPNDMGGIKYLSNQVITWGILGTTYLLTALAFTIAGFAGGPAIAALAAVAGICTIIGSVMWGVSGSANNALQDAIYYAQQGRSYSIYRNTGFLGITTGFVIRV
jgi:hypothetical protein